MSGALHSSTRIEPHPTVRTLQIEAEGDRWNGYKPKIRIMGRWLEDAGFPPGLRVQVTCVAHGIIELRSPSASDMEPGIQSPPEKTDAPF